MSRQFLLVGLFLLATTGAARATNTASSSGIVDNTQRTGTASRGNTVALLETTPTALGQVLTQQGVGYDAYTVPPVSGMNLSQYTDVILGMDGGTLESSDIQFLAAWASGGGRLHFFGGTCWQDYAQAMNQYLAPNDVSNYGWATVSRSPEVHVIDAGSYLAAGLASSSNFSNPSASFYSFRATEPGIEVAADNGDGYHVLFSRTIGSGSFDYCINSPAAGYWGGQDLVWMSRVVANFLHQNRPVPTKTVSWGAIKAGFR